MCSFTQIDSLILFVGGIDTVSREVSISFKRKHHRSPAYDYSCEK